MKLHLAPLQGMTNALYRNLYQEIFGGIDAYYAPFIATTDVRKIGKNLFKDLYPEDNENITVVPQLLSKNGTDFKHYAEIIKQYGYDEVNWNIGCPFPTVTKKKKGSGILSYPELVRTFMEEACSDSYDLSVKMRLGYEDTDEGFEIIEILNDYPVKNVIIHARTGLQRYEGVVNLDAFEALYKTSKHDVIYNGDIFTVEDYNQIQTRFPDIEEFMLGRGALRDPFLPSEIKGAIINPVMRKEKIMELHNRVVEFYKSTLYGERHLCDKMKEFWVYMCVHIDPTGKLLKKVKKARTLSAYNEAISAIWTSWQWQ